MISQQEEEQEPEEERGENLASGASDYGHPNLKNLERFVPPGLNIEHIKDGKTNRKDVPGKKAELAILIQLGLMGAGTPTAEQRIMARSAEFVGEAMIDRSEDGFERKAGISTIDYNYVHESAQKQPGFWSRLRHPNGGGKKEEPLR